MKKKTKIIICIFSILVVVIGLMAYGIHWAFFDIQRISGQEVIVSVDSPDGRYTATAYRNNGGATTGYAVLAKIIDNHTQKSKNIYWQYPCETADIVWLDETTVQINGISLDAWKDTYDYRKK